MKILFLVVGLLAFALSSTAQITATVTTSRAGRAIEIRNDGSLPLNAIALRVEWKLHRKWPQEALEMANVPAKIYLDSLIDPSVTPLAPHEQRILNRGEVSLRTPSDAVWRLRSRWKQPGYSPTDRQPAINRF